MFILDTSEKKNIKPMLGDSNFGSPQRYTDSQSDSEERVVIDDHQYTTQSTMEDSAAINKQLSSEHSYISNPVLSPVMHGISLLPPANSLEPLKSATSSVSNGNNPTQDKSKNDKKVNDLEVVEEAVANIPGMDFVVDSQSEPRISFVEQSKQGSLVEQDLYTSLNEPIAIDIKKPSVNYVCFFSLSLNKHY